MEKTCFKCQCVKPLSDFYAHKYMADGHLNKCKECTRRDVAEHRAANLDSIREYDRIRGGLPHRLAANSERAKTDHGRELMRKAKARWEERNQHKREAHIKVGNAIRAGLLIRQPCERCGAQAQAHHDDYSKPMEVRWLCSRHHADVHKELRAMQRIARKEAA